jgi:DNA-binding transcriptional regulator YiaG
MKKESGARSEEKLKDALKQIQLRAQLRYGRTLTYGDLAALAGVGERSFGDWMRGAYAPSGMTAILELLSRLDERDVSAVLERWRSANPPDSLTRSRKKSKPAKLSRTPK